MIRLIVVAAFLTTFLIAFPGGPGAFVGLVYETLRPSGTQVSAAVDHDGSRPNQAAFRDYGMVPHGEHTQPNSTPRHGRSSRVSIPADPRGHFVADIQINGRSAEALVDTGATTVAIPESIARRSGIFVNSADYDSYVMTANGQVAVARVRLGRIQLDGISIRQVDAVVLPDRALSHVLLGMTFLGELSSFKIESGHLILQY